MWKRLIFLWKRKHFEERSWRRKRIRKHLTFWEAGSGSIFFKTWGRDAEAVEADKFLWKQNRKHFEERSWKRKQTRKRLTLYMELEAEAKNILLSGVGTPPAIPATAGRPHILGAPLLRAPKYCEFNVQQYINSMINCFFFSNTTKNIVC